MKTLLRISLLLLAAYSWADDSDKVKPSPYNTPNPISLSGTSFNSVLSTDKNTNQIKSLLSGKPTITGTPNYQKGLKCINTTGNCICFQDGSCQNTAAGGGSGFYWTTGISSNDIHNTNSGLVGINTASPAAQLDVNGSIQAGNGVVKSTITAQGNLQVGGGTNYLMGSNGIATKNPATNLDVNGNFQVGNGVQKSSMTVDGKLLTQLIYVSTPAIPAIGLSRSSATIFNNQDLVSMGPFVDVRAFGAVGDGVTDDSTAINNAINYAMATGRILLIPGVKVSSNTESNYLCNSKLYFPPARFFRLLMDGGNIVFPPGIAGSVGIDIDTQEQADFQWMGEIVYRGTNIAVDYNARNKVYADNVITLGGNYFKFSTIVNDALTISTTLVHFSGSVGTTDNYFQFSELNGGGHTKYGILVDSPYAGGDFVTNQIQAINIHDTSTACVQVSTLTTSGISRNEWNVYCVPHSASGESFDTYESSSTISLRVPAASAGVFFRGSATGNILTAPDGGIFQGGFTQGQNIIISNDPTNARFITGSLGVGTVSPRANTEIAGGSIRVTGSDAGFGANGQAAFMDKTTNLARIGSISGGGVAMDTALYGNGVEAIRLKSNGSNPSFVGVATTVIPSNAQFISSGTLVAQSTTSTAGQPIMQALNYAGTEVFRAEQDGRVGINTSSPGFPLDVNGAINGQGSIYTSNGSNIGIHTTSPGRALDLRIPTGGAGGAGNYNIMRMSRGDAAPNLYGGMEWTDANSVVRWQIESGLINNDLHISTGDNTAGDYTKVTLQSSGKIGIGTESPSTVLDINGDIQMGSGVNKSTFTTTGNLQMVSGSTITTNGTLTISTATSVSTTGIPAIFIDSSGRVGISTTSPVQPFEVAGNAQIDQAFSSDGLLVFTDGAGTFTTGNLNSTGINGNSGSFNAATQNITGGTGFSPASSSGGVGGTIILTGGTGGNGTGTSGTITGGVGGSASANGGTGGNSTNSGTGTAKGGNGGGFNFTAGAGGNDTASNSVIGTGGTGGTLTFAAGQGGSSNGSTSGTNTGGNAGNLNFNAISGGAAQNSTGTNRGGNASNITFIAGTGGTATGAGGTTAIGGNGTTVTIGAGPGGTASGASVTNTNGNGGNILLKLGAAGGAGAADGLFRISKGNSPNLFEVTTSSTSVIYNQFYVGKSTLAVNNGMVGIDKSSPVYPLDVVGDASFSGQGIFQGTMTVVGNAFSVGVSTLTVTNGKVGITTASPAFRLDTNSYEQITNACTAVTSCTATCSAGKQVTGGGCTGVTSVLADSVAGSATTWTCTITLGNVTAQAICLAIN